MRLVRTEELRDAIFNELYGYNNVYLLENENDVKKYGDRCNKVGDVIQKFSLVKFKVNKTVTYKHGRKENLCGQKDVEN